MVPVETPVPPLEPPCYVRGVTLSLEWAHLKKIDQIYTIYSACVFSDYDHDEYPIVGAIDEANNEVMVLALERGAISGDKQSLDNIAVPEDLKAAHFNPPGTYRVVAF